MGKALAPGHLFKKKKNNNLIVAWANSISWGKTEPGQKKKLKSSQREDLRNETVIGDFENL